METSLNKNLHDLEYSTLDKAEMLTHLNKLLSNYQVFYHKLRVFRWNIVGQDYFELHKFFTDLKERVNFTIDEIAERIRVFDQTPLVLINEYKRQSTVRENGSNMAGFEMVKETLTDMVTILSILGECVKAAGDVSDYGTESMIKGFIYELERDHKILSSWLK
jgi:starvation-inducible DNA-binding protein